MTQFLTKADLQAIADSRDAEKQREAAALRRQSELAADGLRQAFETRELAPEAPERITTAIRRAAERGEHEVLVLRFPSTFTSDGGRRINNFDPEWPSSLEGFGKTAYEFYDKELRPLGYALRAEIMSFPEGMPGDVGLYLKW